MDTMSITIASKRKLNILDRLVLQLAVKTELHLLELLEEPEANNFFGNLAFFGNMALKTNNPIIVHISQWVILVNE